MGAFAQHLESNSLKKVLEVGSAESKHFKLITLQGKKSRHLFYKLQISQPQFAELKTDPLYVMKCCCHENRRGTERVTAIHAYSREYL